MFNNSLPVSSLFCKISLLCLPHCLPACIPCTFCSSIFCTLCAIPLQCTFCLLCISAAALHLLLYTCITHNNNNLISSLYRVLIASVHLVHAMCTMPLPAHTALISSTSRVLCLIIMVTLQLLWRFSHAFSITGCHAEIPQPLWQLRLFVFSGIVELILSASVTDFNAHPLVNPSKNQSSFTGRSLETLQLLWRSHRGLFESSGRDHQWFLAVRL
jgi:hypothetical protein